MSRIKMLNVAGTFVGKPVMIHPVLLQDDVDGATLIDTAFPGQFDRLAQALEQVGVSPQEIRRIVLTHHDLDHVGAVRELIELCGDNLKIYAHSEEREFLEGRRTFIKLTPERVEAILGHFPEPQRRAAAAAFAAIPPFRVDCTVEDGQLMPFHGGIKVIHTPGHTPGHVCLFLAGERALICGDQLQVENGRLLGPAAEHTENMSETVESMKKLLRLNIEHVFAFHGGHCAGDLVAAISELATGPVRSWHATRS